MPTLKDATQDPGVSEDTDQVATDTQDTDQVITDGDDEEIPEPEPYHETRLNAIERIAAENDKARADEFKDGLETDTGPGDDDDPDSDDDPDVDPDDDDPDDPGDIDKKSDTPSEKMVEIVVDGQKRTVPESKVHDTGIRALQKELAADKRLEEATRLLHDAQATIAEVKKGAGQPSATDDGQQGDPQDTATQDAEKLGQRAQELSAAIQYGNEEEAATAVAELISMGRSQNEAATPKQIAETVYQVLNGIEQEKQQKEDAKIMTRFKAPRKEGGFDDISNDPVKMAAASALVETKRAQGDNRTDWEFYQEVGKETRELFGGKKKNQPSSEKRRSNKRDIVNVKSAGARLPAPTGGQPKTEEEARKDALSDIKRARGQTD